MVYLNNDNNKQDVYIPRNDGQGSYVSKYDQGFADGINYQKGKITSITITENGIYENEDGYSPVIVDVDCPEPSLQTKTVVVTADTETITPDAGYDGFGEVNINASQYGSDKYDEGYGDGEDDQKARLTSATFVENGHYELENGWSAVTVQTTCPPCPSPNLENKTVELESGTTLPTTITPSSGYDGFGEVTIEDNGYGDKKYDDGFSDGQDDIRNNMSSTAFTQNGNYSNSSGWSAVTVNVSGGSGSGCSLQNKSVVLTAETQTFTPDIIPSYIGRVEGASWDVNNLIDTGVHLTDDMSVRIKYKGRGVASDRIVGTIDGYGGVGDNNDFRIFDVYLESLWVDVKISRFRAREGVVTSADTLYDFTLGNNYVTDNILNQTYTGATQSGLNTAATICVDVGTLYVSEVIIYDNGVVVFDGTAAEDNGEAGLLDSVSGNFFGVYSGASGTYGIIQGETYDGMSSITVSASALCEDHYTSGYTSGYTDGQADCPSCNTVSDFKTIVTGTDETVCVGFSRPSAPSGETVYGGSYAELKSLIDTYRLINIMSWDNQAHTDRTQEGYFTYSNDQYIYYNHQADIPFPLDEIGPSWTNTGNNDNIFLWGDGMNIFFYTKYEYGWDTNIQDLTPNDLILELAEGDAAECIHIDSSEVYESGRQAGYDDGYNTGTSDAETEHSALYYATDNQQIVNITSAVMYSDFDGTESVNITENIAVFNHNGQLSPPPVSRYSYCKVSVDNQINTLWRLVFDPNERQHITRLWLPDPMFSCWMRTSTGIFYSGLFCEGLTNLQELYLPRDLTRLYGFNDTNNLETLILPARLSVIRNAFKNSSVKVVNLPNSVGEIGTDVFRSSAVEKLIFHDTCWIGSGSFRGDAAAGETGTTQTPALKEIYCYMEYAPIMSNNAGGTIIDPTDADAPFGAQAQNGTLYCPQGKAANYQTFLSYLPSGWTISATL